MSDFVCQFSKFGVCDCGGKWRTLSDFICQFSALSDRFLSVLCVLCGKAFVAVVADYGGKWRDYGGFCRIYGGFYLPIQRIVRLRLWRKMAVFVAVLGMVKGMILEPCKDAAAHFLTAFLPALCVLCGKAFAAAFDALALSPSRC